jgi:phosphatidylglycerophosphate synthase
MDTTPTSAASYPLLRVRAWLAFAATAAGAACVGVALWIGGLSAWAPAKAAALVGAWALLSVPALPDHPRDGLGPANAVTLARGVLVAALVALLGESLGPVAGWWIATAGLAAFTLDWVDGQVARRTGWASPFGARLDMELDALTVLVLCALAWQLGQTGAWILLGGALRYLFVAAGWVWPWMNGELPPSERRRFVCGLQIAALLLCLLPWPGVIAPAIALGGLAALVASFAIDTVWLYRLHQVDVEPLALPGAGNARQPTELSAGEHVEGRGRARA